MFSSLKPIVRSRALTVLWCLVLTTQTLGQSTQKPKPASEDDVVRVQTDLVQSDVMVFDKQGRFFNGLNQADFEVRVDGKPQSVQFFERITAGSANEEGQLAAARGRSATNKEPAKSVPLDRGRTVFFCVDDMHLGPRDVEPTRRVLRHFVEKDMGQNDAAAITSVTGQIGFLQQVTDNKTVLRAAIERLNARPFVVTDNDRPPMTEYQALKVDHYDRELVDFYVEQIMREFTGTTRQMAESQVHQRASIILAQAANFATRALASLESLVRNMGKLPGRKLLFFVSGGFLVDDQNSDSHERLQRITSAALRSGVVIYSMDARGLVAMLGDASSPVAFDPSGRVERSSGGELIASQDAMNALAVDTGGRTIFNTNALDVGLSKALKETSVYYLLAWRPDQPAQAKAKFRKLSVTIPSHPELTVRVHQGFFDAEPAANPAKPKGKEETPPAKPIPATLNEALNAPFPSAGLPVALTVNFIQKPEKGPMLTSSVQVAPESLVLAAAADGTEKATVDIIGAVYNDHGGVGAHFTDRLAIPAGAIEQMREQGKNLLYSYQVYLPPGLYQMRVAVRDAGNGKIGTVNEWIAVPNLASHQLTLSSLIAGERDPQPATGAAGEGASGGTAPSTLALAPLRIDKHFHRNAVLRFLVYIYNAARASDSKPDVALQLQILRDQQPVVTMPLKKLSSEGVLEVDQLPYAADVSLEGLGPGRYILHVTTIDRVSKTSASQAMRFEIE